MHPNVRTGNAAHDRIRSVLSESRRLTVIDIPADRDEFSRDLMVQVREKNLTFYVQAKTLSDDNLDLQGGHIVKWLAQPEPTLLMWWSPDRDEVYWASLWHHLFRKGGLRGKTSTFSLQEDLRLLRRDDPDSWAHFIRLVTSLARLWPVAHDDVLRDYPPYLMDVLLEPDILPYIITCHEAVRLVREIVPDVSPDAAQKIVLRVGQNVAESPENALRALSVQLPQILDNRQVQNKLREAFQTWSRRISLGEFAPPIRLWALNRLLAIIDPAAPRQRWREPYRNRYTWPLMSLAKLIPAGLLLDRLENILTDSPSINSRMHAMYLLAYLDHPDAGDTLLAINKRLRRSEELQKFGRSAATLLIEVEWCAAMQGNEQALHSISRLMETDPPWDVLLPLNWDYYGAEPRKVLQSVALHLRGVSRSDVFMRRSIGLLYRALVTAIDRGLLRSTHQSLQQG